MDELRHRFELVRDARSGRVETRGASQHEPIAASGRGSFKTPHKFGRFHNFNEVLCTRIVRPTASLVPVDFRNGRFRDLAVNERSHRTRTAYRSYAHDPVDGQHALQTSSVRAGSLSLSLSFPWTRVHVPIARIVCLCKKLCKVKNRTLQGNFVTVVFQSTLRTSHPKSPEVFRVPDQPSTDLGRSPVEIAETSRKAPLRFQMG